MGRDRLHRHTQRAFDRLYYRLNQLSSKRRPAGFNNYLLDNSILVAPPSECIGKNRTIPQHSRTELTAEVSGGSRIVRRRGVNIAGPDIDDEGCEMITLSDATDTENRKQEES